MGESISSSNMTFDPGSLTNTLRAGWLPFSVHITGGAGDSAPWTFASTALDGDRGSFMRAGGGVAREGKLSICEVKVHTQSHF